MFSDMIRGKSVAVVGGSNLLVGIKKGTYIDSHDIVVRVNLHWPCPIFYEPQIDACEDIGYRTDILFQALAQWRSDRFFQLHGPKLVFLRGDERFIEEFLNAKGPPYHWMYPQYLRILADCKHKGVPIENFQPDWEHLMPPWNPNTGLLALKCVMWSEPSKVYIVGFDFSVLHIRAVNWHHHDPQWDRRYFREQIANDPRVELHPIVSEAMKSEYVYPYFKTRIKLL